MSEINTLSLDVRIWGVDQDLFKKISEQRIMCRTSERSKICRAIFVTTFIINTWYKEYFLHVICFLGTWSQSFAWVLNRLFLLGYSVFRCSWISSLTEVSLMCCSFDWQYPVWVVEIRDRLTRWKLKKGLIYLIFEPLGVFDNWDICMHTGRMKYIDRCGKSEDEDQSIHSTFVVKPLLFCKYRSDFRGILMSPTQLLIEEIWILFRWSVYFRSSCSATWSFYVKSCFFKI